MLKQEIAKQLERVSRELWPEYSSSLSGDFFIRMVEFTKDDKYGDVTSTLALQLAKELKSNPADVAEKIIENLSQSFRSRFSKIETVMPGFINFTLSKKWLTRQAGLIANDSHYGKNEKNVNEKVQIEFISANPTGPIHVGNGRGAFLGDTLARVLSSQGATVRKEYYVNDAGNQVELLAESVIRRYFQQNGLSVDYPERCYQGDYVKDLAKKMQLGNVRLNDINRIKRRVKTKVLKMMVAELEKTANEVLGVKFHRWFHESELYADGTVASVLQELRERDLVHEEGGATWVKTSQFGDEKDRVIIKSNKEYTYFVSDIAYHWNKFVSRKFDRVINIWGADHQGHVARMQAVKQGLGLPGQLDIIIVQLVRLVSGGKEVRMSKRSGTFVTLAELVEDVGLDVARFFFLMRAADTHMDFDVDLAKEKSEKNPVYYVQYAHARICSILKQPELRRIQSSHANEQFDHQAEIALIRELIKFPDLLADLSQTYEIQRLPFYTVRLAELFHAFYVHCRVIDGENVHLARLDLVKATRNVLRMALKLMGVTAPNSM
ncbi:MAG: arginine--tRNA ligase [bacterium]|nr:arginine--tRNA ligase [bacterium]